MANLYPHFDFGRWEVYPNNTENLQEGGSPSTLLVTLARSQDFSHLGSSSGKATFQNFKTAAHIYSPNFMVNLVRYISGPREYSSVWDLNSQIGREFLFEAWIYTPSSNPIGTDDLNIQIGPDAFLLHGEHTQNITGIISTVKKTVAECKDQWAKIELRFTLDITNAFMISIFADDASLRPGDINPHLNPVFQGNLNLGGVLYVDDITLTDLTALECDLAFSNPAFTKTNETAVDANDGTITINATSSFTREYSLDGANWQLSNFFGGLAPAAYTIYVRDSNPTGCQISQAGVVIAEFEPVEPPPPPVPGPLEVDSQPVNMNNFISWFAAEGPSNFTEIIFSNCCWDFANAYRANKRKRKHYPIVSNGEEFTFYINFETPYVDPNFADFRLDLINDFGVVQQNIGALNKQEGLPTGGYNIWAAVTLANVPVNHAYRLAIRNSTNDAILFISNELEVLTQDEAKCFSTRVQFRASVNLKKYYYLINLPDFYNTIRLRFYKIDQQSEGTIDQYRAVSSGRLRNVAFELDRLLVFESYFFDDLANYAMEVFAAHNSIFLNGKAFLPKGLFKADYVVSNNVNKGKLEMYDQEFSTQDRYGSATSDGLPEPPPDALLGDEGSFILL